MVKKNFEQVSITLHSILRLIMSFVSIFENSET